MSGGLWLLLLSLLLVLLAAAVSALVFILEIIIRGHDLPTSRRARRALIKIIQQYHPHARTFYDLGCAHGSLAITIKEALPQLSVYGIDNSPVRIMLARLRAALAHRRVKFVCQNIFAVDLRQADVIYSYLWYDHLPPLEAKVQAELPLGALVITNTSHFPNWQPVAKIVTYPKIPKTPDFETLFVYIKSKV